MLEFLNIESGLLIIFFGYMFYMSFISFWSDSASGINYYSLGNRTFSVFALSSTIIATWISGSGLVLDLNEFKKDGFIYFIESLGMCANLAIVAWIFVPKMQNFLGKTSIASFMDEKYGGIVGNIVCILGVVTSMGGIGIQFKIMGETLCYFFSLETGQCLKWTILFSSICVILYTSAGGIKNVVRTDIIQTICFSIALFVGIGCFNGSKIPDQEEYNIYKPSFEIFTNMSPEKLFSFFLMMGYFMIPGFKPHVIQRVSMAKNLEQAKKSYYMASIALVIVLILSCYLSYLLSTTNSIAKNEPLLKSLVNLYDIPFVKGIFVIGIISMCMSTADSNLNITAVLIANDFFLFKKLSSLKKIKTARLLTVFIGLLSIIYSIQEIELLEIILLSGTFYLPVVSVPIILSILGFKMSPRCCLVTMIASIFFVMISKFIIKVSFDINFIGMILNLLILLSFHYIVEKWELLKCFGIRSKLKKLWHKNQ